MQGPIAAGYFPVSSGSFPFRSCANTLSWVSMHGAQLPELQDRGWLSRLW
jgi:hypothetical protein